MIVVQYDINGIKTKKIKNSATYQIENKKQ